MPARQASRARALLLVAASVLSGCAGSGSSDATSGSKVVASIAPIGTTPSPPTGVSTATTPNEPAATSTAGTDVEGTTTTAEPVRLIEVTYADGQVAGGAQRTTVRLGEKVRLRVTSDVAELVHVHTYDLRLTLTPGQPGEIDLVASIPGRHEVELEKKRRQLLVLEVR